MGLPILVIDDWPDDKVAIVSRRLGLAIKAAMADARAVAERNK